MLPEGRLLGSRVVRDAAVLLEDALDRRLTGYATLAPRETLLGGSDDRGVLTFADGVPVLAYHAGTDRGGPEGLADLAVPGPYRVELYALDAADLAPVHEATGLRVSPGMPAERLAGAPALAERTRRVAPDDRVREDDRESADVGAVEAFLADEEKVEAIRREARREAERRAEEWGFTDALESE